MQVEPRTLRKVMGVLGVSLPVVLWFFGGEVRDSISAYHDSRVGPVFSGVLFTIGWYLFAYKGYDRRDDFVGDYACVAAISVAIFPHDDCRTSDLHFTFAAILFVLLIVFCCLFTKGTTKGRCGSRKRRRNIIYRVCGGVMAACLIGVSISISLELQIIFWLESAMLWAFGFAWFVKGSDLPGLKDVAPCKQAKSP